LHALPVALGPGWTVRGLQLMQSNHARAVLQIPRVFAEAGTQGELRAFFASRDSRALRHQRSVGLALQRTHRRVARMITSDCSARSCRRFERDQHNENSRGSRLRDLLLDDRE